MRKNLSNIGDKVKLEVLVTTMYQKDISKYFDMNLQTDAVIANQADSENFEVCDVNGSTVKFVTTPSRGLSKNRNIAISNIGKDTDIIVFADDDLKFYDDYEQKIISAFKKTPKAQAIRFNVNCISERKISMKQIIETHRATRREVTSWGVCGLAVKASVIKENSLKFNERFGTGTENYCGEDSIFLQELFKEKVNVYASPEFIAQIDQTDSTWFEGYNEKFFTVAGMIINEIYPCLSYLLVIRSAYKAAKRKTSNLKFMQILKCYYKGVFKNGKERKTF